VSPDASSLTAQGSVAPPGVFHVKHSANRPPWRTLGVFLVALALVTTACTRVAAPEGWAAPVTSGSEIYAQLDRGVLWAFQVNGNAVQRGWRYPATTDKVKFDAFYATPVVDGQTIYLVSHKGEVVALDATNGRPLQSWGGAPVALGQGVVATPVFDGQHLFVATENGDLFSFNAANGQHTRLLQGDGRVWSGLALQGSTVFVGNLDDRRVRAVNTATGAVEWTQSVAGAAVANLAIDGNLLVIGSLDRSVHALDVTAQGSQAWSFTGDGWFAAQPATTPQAIYAASLNGTVYALDPATGTERWQFHQDGQAFRARPVLVGSTLVAVGRDGDVYGLNAADGTMLWHHTIAAGNIDADPLVAGSNVIVITTKGQLARIAADTGDTQILGSAS
jgi:eukaryotic-like serine/threonine-protein kinase